MNFLRLKKHLVMLMVCVVGNLAIYSSALADLVVEGRSQLDAHVMATGEDQFISYNFGRVIANSRVSVDYYLKNTGANPIQVKQVTIAGAFFDADTNCPGALEAGKRCLTRIYYWPPFEGMHSGRLVWYTSDNNVYLNLWGEATRM